MRRGGGQAQHLQGKARRAFRLDLHAAHQSSPREGESLPLPLGSTLLALRSWFWLPHRDMENMSIPGIHCGNGDPTLAVRCNRGKLPEAWGQLQHRVPQAVWSPLLRPSAPGCGLPGLNLSLSTENVRLPPASPQLPGESFSHQRGPKSLFRSRLERFHSRAYLVPSERGHLPPQGAQSLHACAPGVVRWGGPPLCAPLPCL